MIDTPDRPLILEPATYAERVPTSIPTYDKAAIVKKARRKPEELERIAAANRANYPDAEDVKWIQRGVGLTGNDVDGQLGPTTAAFILEWQKCSRFEPTGILDLEQVQHFPTTGDAIPEPVQPVPKFARTRASSKNKPYDHAYFPESDPTSGGWPVIDNQWEVVTSTGSWLAAMLRLLTGRGVNSKGQPYYDREPDDFITLDTYSLGFPHYWAETAPKLLGEIVRRLPEDSLAAWGASGVAIIKDAAKLKSITGTETGARRYNPRTLSWLVAGWCFIARKPEALAAQVEVWAKSYIGEALGLCQEFDLPLDGKEGGLVLAAVARMCNTSPVLARAALKKFWRGGDKTAATGVLRDVYSIDRTAGGYSKNGNGPRRWAVIERTCRVALPPGFLKTRDWRKLTLESLNLTAPIERSRGLA